MNLICTVFHCCRQLIDCSVLCPCLTYIYGSQPCWRCFGCFLDFKLYLCLIMIYAHTCNRNNCISGIYVICISNRIIFIFCQCLSGIGHKYLRLLCFFVIGICCRIQCNRYLCISHSAITKFCTLSDLSTRVIDCISVCCICRMFFSPYK